MWLPKGSHAIVISLLGAVHASGAIKDDVAAVGSPIYLERAASVDRDVISIGSSVYRGPGVRINGRVGGQMVPWSGSGAPGGANWLTATWHYSGLSFAAGLALLLICTCIALAFPWPTVVVSNYLYRDLVRSVVAGLMGIFLFIFLVVPLGLSLFGLPFAVLLAVVATAAWLLGLTACAVMIGRHIARLRRHEAGLLWAIVSGMFALALAGAIPWVGSLIVALCGAAGAGALALTMITRARPGEALADIPIPADETILDFGAYIERAESVYEKPDHRM